MPDTTGSECSGKGRGSHVGQKHFEKAEKESPDSLCYTSMALICIWRQWRRQKQQQQLKVGSGFVE